MQFTPIHNTHTYTLVTIALQQVKFQAIFQCQLDGIIHQAYTKLPKPPELLHLYPGEVPHCWLFEQCAAILHHGGSGTVVTALLSRRPQIICPVMFDQEFWAEQLSWRGLAVRCSSPKQLKEEELVGALRAVRSQAMGEMVEAVARDIEKEDGIETALNCIMRLHKRFTTGTCT